MTQIRARNQLRARGLIRASANTWRGQPWVFYLRFKEASGIKPAEGRQLLAELSPDELAEALGAIPASVLDEDSLQALIKIKRALSGMNT